MNRSAGRLSRHRRGRLAGAVVLLLGLVAAGSLYSLLATGATSSAAATKAATTDTQVEEGRQLFLVSCSSCHGSNGQGITTTDGNEYGPTLVGVGSAAVDFQVGTGRMPMAQPGQQAEAKETAFTQDEIDALAAYVASLGPGPSTPDESDYSIDDLTDEEQEAAIVRGGQIFLTNCTACHNFEGSGGAMPRGGHAPQIRGVEAKYIYEALLTGPQQMPSFSDGNLTPEEKRDVIAYLGSLDDATGYGGFGLGGFGPVAEGLFAWVVGIGSMVGFAVWIAAHTTRSKRKKATA
ncbi:c-type cytochrome [Nocardioides sp. GY 10127]|uniref:cytochrome bc1 complex diheme cytochrome c subunit n=1 Tax=Nocardioides sp. GY 10127 TaxID=2569762 RepID=UPI001F0E2233|nr:c-type cytochrome [Nocardioides sp. GY 10127]